MSISSLLSAYDRFDETGKLSAALPYCKGIGHIPSAVCKTIEIIVKIVFLVERILGTVFTLGIPYYCTKRFGIVAPLLSVLSSKDFTAESVDRSSDALLAQPKALETSLTDETTKSPLPLKPMPNERKRVRFPEQDMEQVFTYEATSDIEDSPGAISCLEEPLLMHELSPDIEDSPSAVSWLFEEMLGRKGGEITGNAVPRDEAQSVGEEEGVFGEVGETQWERYVYIDGQGMEVIWEAPDRKDKYKLYFSSQKLKRGKFTKKEEDWEMRMFFNENSQLTNACLERQDQTLRMWFSKDQRVNKIYFAKGGQKTFEQQLIEGKVDEKHFSCNGNLLEQVQKNTYAHVENETLSLSSAENRLLEEFSSLKKRALQCRDEILNTKKALDRQGSSSGLDKKIQDWQEDKSTEELIQGHLSTSVPMNDLEMRLEKFFQDCKSAINDDGIEVAGGLITVQDKNIAFGIRKGNQNFIYSVYDPDDEPYCGEMPAHELASRCEEHNKQNKPVRIDFFS